MSGAAVLVCILAFLLFGLATEAHHRRRCAGPLSSRRRRLLRIGAWSALAVAFVLAIAAAGWIFGPVLWTGAVMAGAAAAFLALNLLPELSRTYHHGSTGQSD